MTDSERLHMDTCACWTPNAQCQCVDDDGDAWRLLQAMGIVIYRIQQEPDIQFKARCVDAVRKECADLTIDRLVGLIRRVSGFHFRDVSCWKGSFHVWDSGFSPDKARCIRMFAKFGLVRITEDDGLGCVLGESF